MKRRLNLSSAWVLALPIALAVVIVVWAPSHVPRGKSVPAPPAGPTAAPPRTGPALPNPSLPKPQPPNPEPLLPGPGISAPIPLPPILPPALSLPGTAPAAPKPGATVPTDPRLAAAQALARDGETDAAESKLRALTKDPNSAIAAQAQFLLGQTLLSAGDTANAQQAFTQYLVVAPSGPMAAEANFALGTLALQQGHNDPAAGYFQQYLKITADHALDGYALADLAQIDQASGNDDAAMPLLKRAVAAGLPQSRELTAATTVGAALEHAGKPADAAAWYGQLAARPGVSASARSHYQFLQASELQKAGQTQPAVSLYRQVVTGGPSATDLGAALGALQALGQPVDDVTAGEADLQAGQFDAAVAALGHYLDQNPNGPDAANARYDRGRALMGQNSYAAAAAQLDRFVALYPNDPRFGEAALLEGQALEQAGNTSQAVAFLQDFAQKHAGNASAPQALDNAIQYLQQASQSDAATALEKKLLAAFPNSALAPSIAFDLGWASYEKSDFTAARAAWQMVLERWPTNPNSAPALVWLGKLEQQDGNSAAAKRDFALAWKADPGGYYAFRGRALAGEAPKTAATQPLVQPTANQLAQERASFETWLASWTKPSASARSQPYLGAPIVATGALERIQALTTIGLTDDAEGEIKAAMQQYANDGRSLYALADALGQAGLTPESMAAAYQLLWISPAPTAYQSPVFLQRLVYPLPYQDLIVKYADKYGVDPLLLVSLMRQESAFNTQARSPADAIGLTQFMPTTATGVAQGVGLANFTLTDLYQPPVAIQLGAAYLAAQIKDFGGNPYFALAAYNAGSGNARAWLSDDPSRDLDLFVQQIPFAETSGYVRNIYRFYQEYQLLYRAPSG